jgi:hypothetical protein
LKASEDYNERNAGVAIDEKSLLVGQRSAILIGVGGRGWARVRVSHWRWVARVARVTDLKMPTQTLSQHTAKQYNDKSNN